MAQWKKRSSADCPMCREIEDNHHVIQCRSKQATLQWSALVNNLKVHLMSMGTPPEFLKVIIHIVTEYRNKQHTPIAINDDTLLIAFQVQYSIGWGPFIEGVLSQK